MASRHWLSVVSQFSSLKGALSQTFGPPVTVLETHTLLQYIPATFTKNHKELKLHYIGPTTVPEEVRQVHIEKDYFKV